MGKQLVRSVDSIAANISEGYGRYHFSESKRFFYFSRGSLYETGTWLLKAHSRGLLDESTYSLLEQQVNGLARMLNFLINKVGPQQ